MASTFFFVEPYPPPIAVTNPLALGAPLKGKGLANNLFPFPKLEDRTPDQLVKGQSEQPLPRPLGLYG